jgi:hypothetical protein
VSSPPPPYNFAVIPTIASRHPLWEEQLDEERALSLLSRGMLLDEGREALATTPMDAEPERIVKMPEDSFVPFALAVAATILAFGLLLKLHGLEGIGALAVAAALLWWLWPRRALLERAEPAHG